MKKKVSVDTLFQEIAYLTSQQKTISTMLDSKKRLISKYFDKSGDKSLSNEACSIYSQERTKIEYDIKAIKAKLPRKVYKKFIKAQYSVEDIKGLVSYITQLGGSTDQLKLYLTSTEQINQEVLSRMYEEGAVQLSDLQGCYTATISKSVAVRLNQEAYEKATIE